MIRLGICDDDCSVTEFLHKILLQQYGQKIQISTWKVEEIICMCAERKNILPDILLMEADFHKGRGMLLAGKLQMLFPDIKIIFITNNTGIGSYGAASDKRCMKCTVNPKIGIMYGSRHMEYIPEMIQIEPSYLLKKPVIAGELINAIEKTLEKIRMEEAQLITLECKSFVIRLNTAKITYVETQKRKLLIHQKEGMVSVYMKMDEFEKQLESKFLRCHHSYLVNMEFVKYISVTEIELFDGTKIPVSRSKAAGAREKLLDYLKKRK